MINKYHTWYNSLIERARNRVIDEYIEKHHIIPRSLGGTDDPENLVDLTAREHLIAHMLLPRFVENSGKMWSALWGMMNTRGLRIGSRVYEEARIRHARALSVALRGRPNPGVSAALKGRPNLAMKGRPSHWKGKPNPGVSAALKGRSRSEETKAKIAAALMGRPNPKVSTALKGRKKPEHSAALKEYWAKKKLASSEEVV